MKKLINYILEKNKQYLFVFLLSYLFVISLVPFNYIPVRIFNIPLHFLLISVISSSLIILAILSYNKITDFDMWMIFLLLSFALSLITSVDKNDTFRSLLSFIFKGFGIAFIAERIMGKNRNKFISVLIICGVAVSIIGLFEYVGLSMFNVHLNPWYKFASSTNIVYGNVANDPDRPCITSTIGHPNTLGAYIVLILPISLYFVEKNKSIYRFFPIILFLLNLLLTLSRGSWISGVISIVLFFFLKIKKTLNSFKYSILIVILTLSVPLMLSVKLNHFIVGRVNLNVQQTLPYIHRIASYETTKNILKDYLFTGVGLGNYPKVHEKYIKDAVPTIKTPDNMYLRFLCDTGIIGFSAFMIFIFYWMWKLWKNRNDVLVFAIFCGLLGFLINMLTVDLLFWQAPSFLFWMLLGAGVGIINNKETNAAESSYSHT